MIIKAEYINDILGSGVVFQGPSENIGDVTNVVAKRLAEMTAADGLTHKSGMWIASVVGEHEGGHYV